MGTPFDPSQLANPLWLFRGDGATTTFNYADLRSPDIFHPQYFQTASSAFLNGLTRLTIAFTVVIPSNQAGAQLSLLAQEDGTGTQECFSVVRLPSSDTPGNGLQVRVASSLTDTLNNWGKFGSLTPLDGRMSHFTTPAAVNGTVTPQLSYTVVIVYDGTLVGNANRLKCYLNGVLDPAPTFQGTIPAGLTSSSAPISIGYGLFQGGLCKFGLYNVGLWAGVAFTGAQAAAFGAVARSGWPAYKTYAQLLATGVPAATAFWQLSEVSNGSGAVGRADSTAGGRTLTEAGSGGFVASQSALQWTDEFFGDVAQSVTYVADNTLVAQPFVVAGDTPSGKPAVRFPTGYTTYPNATINQMQLGKAGRTNWPTSARLWVMLKKDANAGDSVKSEQNICGADSTNGADNQSVSTNCFMGLDTEDFSFGSFTFYPGSVSIYTGSGLGNWNLTYNDPNSHPGANAGTGPANTYAPLTYFLIRGRFTAGTDVCPQLWINSVQQAVINQGETPTIPTGPTSPHYWEDITQCGAVTTCYCLGGVSGEWTTAGTAALQGNISLFCLTGGGDPEDQALRMDVWVAKYGGLAVTVPTPTGLATVPTSPQVALTWNAVTGATSYNLYRSPTPGGEVLLVNVAAGPSYNDTNVTPGTTYYYKVSALIETTLGDTESALSAEVSAAVPAVGVTTGLTVTGNSTTGLNHLAWTAPATGATSYKVYRSTSPGTETLLASPGGAGTTYDDTTAVPGTPYYYQVTSVVTNVAGTFESGRGTEVSGSWTLTPPSDLVASLSGVNALLTWTSPPVFTTFTVLRGTTPGSETSYATGLTSPTYTDLAATPGTVFYYVVEAVYLGGNSVPSNEVSISIPQVTSLLPVNGVLNISQFAGEDRIYRLPIFQAGSTTQPQNVQGWSATFAVHAVGDPSSVYLSKTTAGGTVVASNPLVPNPPGIQGFDWGFDIDVLSTDTVNMFAGEYGWYFQRTDSPNSTIEVSGLFTLKAK